MIHDLSHRLRDLDEVRFFLNWLRKPGRVGAVVPSGPALAAALAAEIDTDIPGTVLELGPGTGRVTAALLEASVAPSQLVAVERDATFCRLLRERFPDVRIVSGDARSLVNLLDRAKVGPVKAVVSSLPLLSMPNEIRSEILYQIAAALDADGVLVQYTYGLAAPVSAELCAELGMTGERTDWVLANLPPAAVWRYRSNSSESRMSSAA